jgi:hypothetical protein
LRIGFLKRILELKRDEVTRGLGKPNNQQINDLFSSPNIIWLVKSRRSWAGHVARVGEESCIPDFGEKPEGKNNFEDPGEEGRITLRRIFRKLDGGMEWICLAHGCGLF